MSGVYPPFTGDLVYWCREPCDGCYLAALLRPDQTVVCDLS